MCHHTKTTPSLNCLLEGALLGTKPCQNSLLGEISSFTKTNLRHIDKREHNSDESRGKHVRNKPKPPSASTKPGSYGSMLDEIEAFSYKGLKHVETPIVQGIAANQENVSAHSIDDEFAAKLARIRRDVAGNENNDESDEWD